MSHPGRLNSRSMKAYLTRIVFGMTLLLLPVMLIADADTPHYRIEVIVFAHADGRPDARHVQHLEDFSALTDPLALARKASAAPAEDPIDEPVLPGSAQVGLPADGADDETLAGRGFDEMMAERTRQAELEAMLELIDTLDGLEEGTLMPELPTWPDRYLALERLSPKMERALERLENSAGHDVLAWRAWHQPLARGLAGERVRIHDDQPVAADWLKLTPVGLSISEERDSKVSETLTPAFHYRLDGGIRLRQRQFMHLESDLHWRTEQVSSPWMPRLELHDEPTGGYQLHRLNQSRTVRPDRLEYFDSSWLGMLVLIEAIEPLDGSDIDHDDDDFDTDMD